MIQRFLKLLARCICGHPWITLLAPLCCCLLSLPLAMRVTSNLSTSGFLPESAESLEVANILAEEFGRDTTSHFLLFSDDTGELAATDPEFRVEVARTLAPIRELESVTAVYWWGSTDNDILNANLLSDDGTRSLAIVVMDSNGRPPSELFDEFSGNIQSDRLTVKIGGWPAVAADFSTMTKDDLIRSEQIALPVTLLMLVIVFGGFLAAAMPVALAVCALIPTLGCIYLLSTITETSVFAVNTASMLGLALGVDYALILVTRYREELQISDKYQALKRAMITSGETILVSGAAVMVGLLGLLSFDVPAATSTGLAAGAMVVISMLLSLTALPAAMVLLSDRIRVNRRLIPAIKLPIPSLRTAIANHPVLATILTVSVILFFSHPVLNMQGTAASMKVLPESRDARQVFDEVSSDFSSTTVTPILVVLSPTKGSMIDPSNLNALLKLQVAINDLEGVESSLSVWNFVPIGVPASFLSTGIALDETIREVTRPYITSTGAVLELAPSHDLTDPVTVALVRLLRDEGYAISEGNFTLMVGSEVGTNVDLLEYIEHRAPLTFAIVIALTWLALFWRFRSVVLPTKAVLLNLLSLGASFGSLVWIFQEGHLSQFLGFEPLGTTILLVPIIMFCFLFGMSMDYEVIMLSRIKEVWDETGDNQLAVEQGLASSAKLVTSAAAIMLVVFLAFSTSELQFIKQIGITLGIAVIIDTTLIRLILLPSIMRMFGESNWWPGTKT